MRRSERAGFAPANARAARRLGRRAAEVRSVYLGSDARTRVPDPVTPVQAGRVLVAALVAFDVAVFVMDVLF